MSGEPELVSNLETSASNLLLQEVLSWIGKLEKTPEARVIKKTYTGSPIERTTRERHRQEYLNNIVQDFKELRAYG